MIFFSFFAATVLAFGSASDRDWAKNPAIVQVDTAADIFAIGDVHSDYVRLTLALKGAGLIERIPDRANNVRWTGGKSIFVITGDMIDKGPRAVDVLTLIRFLQVSASSQGGRVIALAGNHEAEFLADPKAKKGREFAAQLTGAGFQPSAVAACEGDVGEFLCSLPFGARVNDWFFSHAGNTGGRSLARLREDLETGVIRDGFKSLQLIGDNSLLEARLNGKGREPWIDAGLPEQTQKQLLTQYATALGVKHFVEGHVPGAVSFMDGILRNAGEMFQIYGLLFLIDTGMSEGVDNSHGAVLHITSNKASAVCFDGEQTVLWDSKTRQLTGCAAPCRKR
jgi:hypothetical protein